MSNERSNWVGYILIAVGLILVFLGKNGQPGERVITITDTIVKVRWDTVIIDRPTEVVRYIVRRDTIKIADRPEVIIRDDSTVIIPIEQAIYHDSTASAIYTAFITGYEASLDSILIDCRCTDTVFNNTAIKKPNRIGLGLQVGMGVGKSGLTPYAGVGIFYRIF